MATTVYFPAGTAYKENVPSLSLWSRRASDTLCSKSCGISTIMAPPNPFAVAQRDSVYPAQLLRQRNCQPHRTTPADLHYLTAGPRTCRSYIFHHGVFQVQHFHVVFARWQRFGIHLECSFFPDLAIEHIPSRDVGEPNDGISSRGLPLHNPGHLRRGDTAARPQFRTV